MRALSSPSLNGVTSVVAALAALGMVGALVPGSGLRQPLASFPAMTVGAALGSTAVAAALMGRALRRRWIVRAGGVLAAALGLAVLVMRSTSPQSIEGGRRGAGWLEAVPPTSALLLTLCAVGLLALTWRRDRSVARAVAGVLGAVALLLSITVLLGRVVGSQGGTDVVFFLGASPYVLAICGITGGVLMRLAASTHSPRWPLGRWLPNAVGVGAALTVIFAWLALVQRDEEQMQRQIDLAAVLANRSVRAELVRLMNGVERLAMRAAVRTPSIDSALVAQVRVLVADETQPIAAAAWPRAGTPRARAFPTAIVVPSDSAFTSILPAMVARMQASPAPPLVQSEAPSEFIVSPTGREAFALGVRDCSAGPCRAPFAVLFDARRAFRTLLADSLTGFHLAVRLGSSLVVRSAPDSASNMKWLRTAVVDVPAAGARWQIAVWPTASTLARAQSDLPEGVLLLGLVLAVLLPVTLRLADTAWTASARAERLRVNAALESATDSLWVWDIVDDTIERGRALWTRLGHAPPLAAVPLSQWLQLVHPKDRSDVTRAMSRHLAGATESIELEYRVRDADDRWHWLVERGRVVERSEGGLPLRALGVTADITERKNADAALAASERKYRATFDSASQMKALLDERSCVREMNPAGRRLCADEAAVIGRPIWEFPAFRGSETVRQSLEEACARGYTGMGSTFVLQREGDYGEVHTWDLSVTPIASDDGTITQLLVNARDITDRKRAEQALRELGNLATMGRLTALVAHEINNPLAGIHSAFSLVKHAVPETHPHYKYVGAIEREIARIAQVTRQLYETYRHEPEASRGASVETVVGDAVAFIEQVNRAASVRISVDLTAAPAVVPFPDALIRRVVYNLVQNAVDASPRDGTVYVTATHDHGLFTLAVRDQGSGIPPEVRGRIFDPFVSTKEPGRRTGGMGMGLALVHGSVTAFGGAVGVHDAPEGGSVFVVRLPLPHSLDGTAYGNGTHSAR
ncbi:MAG: Adaptive-response sensory-kinase SasA [Gemmatimonadaceae bacterium]|nr:Adaptive-response sensory-kinase SasA [Gemmatimonadaceae bacterium]